jgi:hypothetical protein
MTVYSRSDVAAISISPAHGGCGVTHSRPAPGGKPIPVWQLACPRCEDFLRADPLWGPTQGSIPETPDEEQTRTAAEGRTQREQLTNNVDALSRIGEALTILAQNQNANQSPDTAQLMAMMTAVLAHNGITVPAQTAASEPEPVPVADGTPDVLTHAQAAELESALNAMNDDPAWTAHVTRAPMPQPTSDLDAMGLPALNDYAKALGLPGRRSKADQIAAIRDRVGE